MPTVRVRRTFLELPDRDALRPPGRPAPDGATIERLEPCPVALYRALYRAVGDRWHWHDQNAKGDAELEARLADPQESMWGLRVPGVGDASAGGYAGWFELIARAPGTVEIIYFGLVPAAFGRGLGGWLLVRAVETAWSLGAERVILDTCSLDAPQALPNYLARGFQVVRVEQFEKSIEGTADGDRLPG